MSGCREVTEAKAGSVPSDARTGVARDASAIRDAADARQSEPLDIVKDATDEIRSAPDRSLLTASRRSRVCQLPAIVGRPRPALPRSPSVWTELVPSAALPPEPADERDWMAFKTDRPVADRQRPDGGRGRHRDRLREARRGGRATDHPPWWRRFGPG